VSTVDNIVKLHRAIVSAGVCPGSSRSVVLYLPETTSIKFRNNMMIISGEKIDTKFLENQFKYLDPANTLDYTIISSGNTITISYYRAGGTPLRFKNTYSLTSGIKHVVIIFEDFTSVNIYIKD